ncbi:MAG: T9SS type A sorting domain-containing protein [Bacteroidales bacterium]|nr:T9SS type A sorting domain-containing protein [Bacteroidales bacterium]
MKMFFLKITLCFFVVLIGSTQQATAQNEGVILRHLEVNPVLINATSRDEPKRARSSAELERQPLKLPFFDDFSSLSSPFPNDLLWEDNMVFINASFPLFPPTIGVATFDALDANGRLYEHASVYPFGADTLTSRPIRLDSIFDENPREITSMSNVYFSFYFQPGGGFGTDWDGTLRGRAPRRDDLLILEFRDNIGDWNMVWYANGETLERFCPLCVVDSILITPEIITETDTIPAVFRRVQNFEKEFFRQVHIPIAKMVDSLNVNFFYNEFQFRFRNINTLDPPQNRPAGRQGGGQWHIDYVRLDVYPDGFSKFLPDIAFVEPGERVLRDFQAMPANQFQVSDLVNEIPILFRNLDNVVHPILYHFRITGPNYFFWDTTASNTDVEPFYTHGFNSSPGIDIYYYQRNFSSRFPPNPDSGEFRFHLVLTSNRDINRSIDTMTQTLHFGNYFAYDDGTPEAGFGFSREATWPISRFAYQFPLRVADSLIGIQIWLNHTTESNRTLFNLAVWTENDGVPSQNPIHEGQDLLLDDLFGDSIGFFTYWFDSPLALNPGNFYIGFQQRNNFFLNVGFDLNNNAANRMFMRFEQGQWTRISLYGAVMMRPIFGASASIPTNILEREEPVEMSERIRVFPNPTDGIIFVESLENVVNRYEIFDLNGRKLLERVVNNTQFSINLPQNSGIYVLVLHTENGVVSKRVIRR